MRGLRFSERSKTLEDCRFLCDDFDRPREQLATLVHNNRYGEFGENPDSFQYRGHVCLPLHTSGVRSLPYQ
ncbi:hypothetical protein RRG08_004346 [Elysia crispata]|uniref:Uncharacterized protein n=1 Tax=Elysia crispata TaxID=231223 RepID=A0AAE1AYB1_9GAST|nr:hypothetical protein RRG08_004346 [Elysia crispata]